MKIGEETQVSVKTNERKEPFELHKRFWNVYLFFCIKTPIVAVGIITILLLSMNALMDGIKISQYLPMTAEVSLHTNSVTLEVNFTDVRSDIGNGDPIIWFTHYSGNRYEGKVLDINHGQNTTAIRISAKSEDWADAKAEARSENGKLGITVDVPVGESTVKQRLFSNWVRKT